MDADETYNCGRIASSNMENEFENLGKIRTPKVSDCGDSEQNLKDIFKPRKGFDDNPDDSGTKKKVKNDQHAKVLAQQYESNSFHSPLKEGGKIKKSEIISRKIHVKIQKNIKCGSIYKSQMRRPICLRRRALLLMTKKKNFLFQTKRCSESEGKKCFESEKSPIEFEDLQDEKSKTAAGVNAEMKINSFGSRPTNSPFVNKIQMQPISTNRLQEVSANKNLASYSSRSAPITTRDIITNCQSEKDESAEEVWEHFKWYMRTNSESLNRSMTYTNGTENMETSEDSNQNLKDPTMTAKKFSIQSLNANFKTKSECATNEIQDLSSEKSTTWDDNPISVLKRIELIRLYIINEILKCEQYLKSLKVDGQQEKSIERKMKYLTDAKDLETKLHLYFDILCDYQKFFNFVRNNEIFPFCDENNLPHPASLMDLTLLPIHMLTFSSLFLYLYNSLYSKVPIKNIFKKVDFENCKMACRRYQKRKAMHKCEIKSTEDVAVKHVACFNVALEECRSKMTRAILHSENMCLDDYQNCIIALIIAVGENLNCLKELLSAGSSVVFPIVHYLSKSRLKTLEILFFLDKRRPEVFSLFK